MPVDGVQVGRISAACQRATGHVPTTPWGQSGMVRRFRAVGTSWNQIQVETGGEHVWFWFAPPGLVRSVGGHPRVTRLAEPGLALGCRDSPGWGWSRQSK